MRTKLIPILFIAILPIASIAEIISTKINVLGRVEQQGQYIVNDHVTLIDAIALAGGVARLGDVTRIKVRKEGHDGKVTVEIYDLKKIIVGEQQNPILSSGDLVYIEERCI